MSQRCVTLVGPMGSGKSAVGRALAELLGYDFVDTDDLIVRRTGKTIPQIFEEHGETGFRALESEVILTLEGSLSRVIATGGGAVIDPQNRQVFRRIGHTVYLKASPRELYQRIKNDANRPLIANSPNPRKEIERILLDREPFYKKADITVETDDLSVAEVADYLLDEMAKRTAGDG